MPMSPEAAELMARQSEDCRFAIASSKEAALPVRSYIDNRDDGWWFVICSDDRDMQKPIAEFGPYKTATEAEGLQAKYEGR